MSDLARRFSYTAGGIPLRDSALGLGSLFAPAMGLAAALVLAAGDAGVPRIFGFAAWPWELWVLSACGVTATACGILDWHLHVTGGRVVGKGERHGELIALAGGGFPLFCLMIFASASARPELYLLPIIIALLFTVAMICYDEFVYHRRACGRYETMLHRGLVFGNGAAWLAWMHWIYVRG